MMQNMNETGANQGTALRELSLDEAEMVGGGFGPITTILVGGGTIGLGAGIIAGGKKVGEVGRGLLGNGGGKHVKPPSSGQGGGKHVRPSNDSKSSILGWGDGFDAFV
jgi:hypothetical protein